MYYQPFLVKVDHNRYSVPAEWANRVVSLRLTADRLRLVADGQVIAEHLRCYERNQLLCDPWHYLPILEKKPGALRHGAPFQQWDLPTSIRIVRDRILKRGLLTFVLTGQVAKSYALVMVTCSNLLSLC